MTATRIGTQRDILGECPLWDEQEQALFWVDIRKPALRRLDPATRVLDTRPMPGLVGAIALAGPGRKLVALAEQVAVYDWQADRLETVTELPARIPGHRFNDGRCDRAGRFWVGTMHNETRAPEGVLYRLDRDGLVPILDGICVPNSLAWSPDGLTMYFADSLRYAIARHEFEPETGRMGPALPFVTTVPPGFPDGSTVDAEGFLWNAEFNAGRVVRYAPDGMVDQVIELPTTRPTSCCFGGPDLRTLFITSTSQAMSDAELEADPSAGALFALDAGVSGIPEPSWAGLVPA